MTTVATESNHPIVNTTANPSSWLGMVLFLSAETMFFLGLLSALLVLAPTHGPIYRRSLVELSKTGLISSIACLAAMSVIAVRRPWSTLMRCAAMAIAVVFLSLQALQYTRLLRHETVVASIDGRLLVLDGAASRTGDDITITGTAADLPDHFDAHELILPKPFTTGSFTASLPPQSKAGKTGTQKPPTNRIIEHQTYGPGRTNFFSSYFILTGVHIAHLIGGMVALLLVTIRRRPAPAVELYWHTINAIGIVCLLAIWLI